MLSKFCKLSEFQHLIFSVSIDYNAMSFTLISKCLISNYYLLLLISQNWQVKHLIDKLKLEFCVCQPCQFQYTYYPISSLEKKSIRIAIIEYQTVISIPHRPPLPESPTRNYQQPGNKADSDLTNSSMKCKLHSLISFPVNANRHKLWGSYHLPPKPMVLFHCVPSFSMCFFKYSVALGICRGLCTRSPGLLRCQWCNPHVLQNMTLGRPLMTFPRQACRMGSAKRRTGVTLPEPWGAAGSRSLGYWINSYHLMPSFSFFSPKWNSTWMGDYWMCFLCI